MIIVLYAALGAVAGFLAGLFGVGGGLVIVPALVIVFTQQGIAENIIAPLALGTSMATLIFTSASAVISQQRRGAIPWPQVLAWTPSLVVGTLLGGTLAHYLPTAGLRGLIGLFTLGLALWMAWGKQPPITTQQPLNAAFYGMGVLIATLSTLLGIGGGSVIVPYLRWRGTPLVDASAMSSSCSIPIALVGTAAYLVSGWHEVNLLPHTVGYVYLPALLGILITSSMAAPFGVAMAHRWPPRRLQQGFALLLGLISLKWWFF